MAGTQRASGVDIEKPTVESGVGPCLAAFLGCGVRESKVGRCVAVAVVGIAVEMQRVATDNHELPTITNRFQTHFGRRQHPKRGGDKFFVVFIVPKERGNHRRIFET